MVVPGEALDADEVQTSPRVRIVHRAAARAALGLAGAHLRPPDLRGRLRGLVSRAATRVSSEIVMRTSCSSRLRVEMPASSGNMCDIRYCSQTASSAFSRLGSLVLCDMNTTVVTITAVVKRVQKLLWDLRDLTDCAGLRCAGSSPEPAVRVRQLTTVGLVATLGCSAATGATQAIDSETDSGMSPEASEAAPERHETGQPDVVGATDAGGPLEANDSQPDPPGTDAQIGPDQWRCYVQDTAPSRCFIDCFRHLTRTGDEDAGHDAGPAILIVDPASCTWPAGFRCILMQSGYLGADWCNCTWPSATDGGDAPLPSDWTFVTSCPP